ncbi:MAG: flippase [Candidatus Aureabacteria bacterium]|nr:flippase [Candidatus Auribacterota bacterium]
MNNIKKIAKNSAIMIIVESINKVLSLFLTVVLARYLGDYVFGEYSFVLTMVMLFNVLAVFGLDTLAVREISKNIERTGLYLFNLLFLKILMAVFSFIVLVGVIKIIGKPESVNHCLYFAGFIVFIMAIADSFGSIFNAHEKLELKAFSLLATKIFLVILLLLAVFFKKGIVSIVFLILLSEIFRLILSVFIYRLRLSTFSFRFDMGLCKSLLRDASSFALISAIAIIYFKIDIVMLSLLKNDQVVGWYSAAYNLVAALIFIAGAYNLAIYPSLSRDAGKSQDLLSFRWQKSVKYLFVISIPITVGTLFLADRFIELFYSTEYYNSGSALKILVVTLPWIFVNSINMQVLYAFNMQLKASVIMLVCTLVNISLNLYLIPRYSYIGASIATLLAEIINVVLCFFIVARHMQVCINYKNTFIMPLIAAGIMGFVIHLLNFINLFLLVFIGVLTYMVFLYFLKVLDEEDKRIIASIIR